MAALLDTPSRVLKRVQQYEEMELPSLPSFHRDDLDDSDDYDPQESYVEKSMDVPSEDGYDSTPHIARTAGSPPPTTSTARTESTVKPMRWSPMAVPTPTLSSIQTLPNSELDISYGSILSSSDTSTRVLDEAATQHTYGDYSSISERLPAAFSESDCEDDPDDIQPSLATPIPRAPFGQQSRAEASLSMVEKTPKPVQEVRVPSLSRSEVSATDNEATTPEGREGLHAALSSNAIRNVWPDETKPDTTYDSVPDVHVPPSASSPPRMPSSPEATPVAIRYMDQPSTAARAAAIPFGTTAAPLRDLTPLYRNRQSFTPSAIASPSVDYTSTPRAPLDDAARRKSHVLSVLASASLPSRVRSRPSPLRPYQHTALPQGDSPAEGPSSATWLPGFTADRSDSVDDNPSPNTSALSLASHDISVARYRRGNTSVPDVLLANAGAFPGSNLNLENRPDAVKIHKHLNKMNQELLDTNEQLAREAEDWRGECLRLISVMRESGFEVDDQGLVGGLALGGPTKNMQDSETSEAMEHPSQDTSMRRQLQEARDELSKAQNEFQRRTAEHQRLFTEIGNDYAHQVEALEENLDAANAEMSDLRTQLDMLKPSSAEHEDELRRQITILGDDLARAHEDAHVASEQVATAQTRLSEAQAGEQATLQQLQDSDNNAEALQSQLDGALRRMILSSRRAEDLENRLTAAERLVEERVQQSSIVEARLSSIEAEKVALQAENTALSQRINDLEGHHAADQDVIVEQRKVIQELENGSDSLGGENLANQNRIADLESILSATQAAQASTQAELESAKNRPSVAKLRSESIEADDSHTTTATSPPSIVATLEERLDEAHRLIGRLKAERDSSPARLATLEARDARIRVLETEKETLLERLKAREMPSPARGASSMRTSTPVVHKAISALRTPRTPGPLKDLSWLQSTIDDSNESILRAQVEHLLQELDVANTQLDKNFDRLEDAGLGAVRLAELLAAANGKIAKFEEERTLLASVNKQSETSLHRGRDKNEQLEHALETVHERLASLRDNMTAEKERLQEDNRRLRLQLTDMRHKYDEELEFLSAETARIQEEAQDDIADAAQRLERIRNEKEDLATELHNSEALVKQLEDETSTLHSTIDEMSIAFNNLRGQLATARQAQDEVQSLQTALAETRSSMQSAQNDSGRLRDQLRRRSDELHVVRREVDTLKAERERVTRELAQFSADLGAQRRECVAFGAELEVVRQERATAQSAHAEQVARIEASLQNKQSELMRATQHAKETQQQCLVIQEQLECHKSQAQTTAGQGKKFKVQARRLSAQIEYLKAVYARENTFRSALALQKKFLLLLVGGMSLNEQATLRAIASTGYEIAKPARPQRTFKAVGLAVLSIIRARRMAAQWQATRVKRNAGIERK